MDSVLAYIQETLHVSADISEYDNIDGLPLYLRNGYDLSTLSMQNTACLLVRPTEKVNLTDLRKQSKQLRKLTGLDSVLCLDDIRIYTKEKMLSEGIPFISPGKQIYMPFLGVALTNNAREIPQADEISFGAQKLLLTAIYQNWTNTTATEAAGILGVSKMSVTRCFDHLQSAGLDLISQNGKTRRFVWSGGRRALWAAVLPHLRNPVQRQYRLGMRIETAGYKLGGLSALCHYSMLADNSYTTYSVGKGATNALELNKQPSLPEDETPNMVIQVMRYELSYLGDDAVDPLTAILSLTDDDKSDPRVEAAIEEVLEECLRD